MPDYDWECPVCHAANVAGRESCLQCRSPASLSANEIERLRVAYHEDPGFDPGAIVDFGLTDTVELTAVAHASELPLRFHGTAREYFCIWVVNLCLTLLTLGIYSAWAKVRKKRYFYSHITLDDTPFQYLARPLPILKGRIIAVILALTYYSSSHFFLAILPYVLVVGLIMAPWVIARSAAFNARYSAYRNMTFRFDGGYREAVTTIYVWGLIPAIVVGMMFNWWDSVWIPGLLFGAFSLLFPWWMRRLKAFIIERTSYGGAYGRLTVTGGQLFAVYAVASLIVVGGAIGAVAMAGTMMHGGGDLSPYAFLFFGAPFYLGYVLAFAYIQAHISNRVWNHARLGSVRFRSTLLGRELAMLYVTNALGIIASLGLLIPWAVIRTLRYRVEHMQVFLLGDLSAFQGEPADTVRAAGSEIGEFFDVDLSL